MKYPPEEEERATMSEAGRSDERKLVSYTGERYARGE